MLVLLGRLARSIWRGGGWGKSACSVLPRPYTDGRSAIRNVVISGNVLGASAVSAVKAEFRGKSSVVRGDDGDDKGGIEDDVGALQDQSDLLTQRPAEVKMLMTSMILSPSEGGGRTRCNTILQFHRRLVVGPPRHRVQFGPSSSKKCHMIFLGEGARDPKPYNL